MFVWTFHGVVDAVILGLFLLMVIGVVIYVGFQSLKSKLKRKLK